MAALLRFLISRAASGSNLCPHLRPRCTDPSSPAFQFVRSLHSLISRRRDVRGFVSEPGYRIEEAGAAALGLDDRVPATVITGFLGSGKVGIFSSFVDLTNCCNRWCAVVVVLS